MRRKTLIFLFALFVFFGVIISQSTIAEGAVNKASILFTFDDGSIDNLTNAAPILANAGFKATAYVTKDKALQYWSKGIMNDQQLAMLYNQYGWDIANHTVSHTQLGLSNDEASLLILKKEYLDNQNWLISMGFNRAAYDVAYPYGFYTPELIQILKTIGVKTGRTVVYGFETIPVTDYYQLKSIAVKSNNIDVIKSRIDEAVLNKYTLMLLFHGVDDLTVDNESYVISPDQFQQVVDYVQMYVNQGLVDVQTISQWYSMATSFDLSFVSDISVSANNTTNGTVTGGGTFKDGNLITIKATPKEGYRFISWTEGTTTVSNSATYQFTVKGNRTLVANFAAISTPTLSSVASASPSSIKLSWGAITGSSHYQIFRATSATGTYTNIGNSTSTTFINTGLVAGRTYYYKVRACATTGSLVTYGSLSAYKYAVPKPATPALTAVSSGYASIKTSWSAVLEASGYELYRATSATGAYTYIGPTTKTSFNNSNLITGKYYYYRVRAYHLEGTTKIYGSYSAYKGAQPLPSTPVLSVVKGTGKSANVSWTGVAGGSYYQVYRATSATGSYSLVYTGGSAARSFNNINLTSGLTYYYKVRTYTVVGTSKFYSAFSTVKSIAIP